MERPRRSRRSRPSSCSSAAPLLLLLPPQRGFFALPLQEVREVVGGAPDAGA